MWEGLKKEKSVNEKNRGRKWKWRKRTEYGKKKLTGRNDLGRPRRAKLKKIRNRRKWREQTENTTWQKEKRKGGSIK